MWSRLRLNENPTREKTKLSDSLGILYKIYCVSINGCYSNEIMSITPASSSEQVIHNQLISYTDECLHHEIKWDRAI